MMTGWREQAMAVRKARAMGMEYKRRSYVTSWTDEEMQALRTIYPIAGWKGVAKAIGRTEQSIRTMAKIEGLRVLKGASRQDVSRAVSMIRKIDPVKKIAEPDPVSPPEDEEDDAFIHRIVEASSARAEFNGPVISSVFSLAEVS